MGVDPADIVTMPSPRKVPEAIFEKFKIENIFNVSFVNNLSFSQILEDRLVISGSNTQICDGIYFFDNLEIKGKR